MIPIIDRFEDGFAVCQDIETEKVVDIPITALPPDAKVGDVLINVGEKYIIDKQHTSERKKRIRALMEGLWE